MSFIEPEDIEYYTFFMDITGTDDTDISLEDVARNFRLDVTMNTKNGAKVMQNGNIVKSSHEVCSSVRQINKMSEYVPQGFTQIIYPANGTTVKLMYPPEIIPTGCWCSTCFEYGPNAHKMECSKPTPHSLQLTLKGLINCYSVKKIRLDDDQDLKSVVESFFAYYQTLVNTSSSTSSSSKKNDNIEEHAFNTFEHNHKNLLFEKTVITNEITTSIQYARVASFETESFFSGCVTLQYYNKDGTKVSIRVYNKKLALVSCPYNERTQVYNEVVKRLAEMKDKRSKQDIPQIFNYHYSSVKYCKGKFRLYPTTLNKSLDLHKVYDYFSHTDVNEKNHLVEFETQQVGAKETVSQVYLTTEKEGEYYKYLITEPSRGKMSVKDMIFCKVDLDEQLRMEHFKVTAQIYNSGIIQLIFSYVNKDEDADKETDTNPDNGINKQLMKVHRTFLKIRELFDYHFKRMDEDVFIQKAPVNPSEHVWNTIPGHMPYTDLKLIRPGMLLEVFDSDDHRWTNEKVLVTQVIKDGKNIIGYEVMYDIPYDKDWTPPETTGKRKKVVPRDIEQLDTAVVVPDSNIDKDQLPSGKIQGTDTEVYIIGQVPQSDESYIVEKDDSKLEKISNNLLNYRVYKTNYSSVLYNSTMQVSQLSKDGVPMQPEPYSFYGVCPNPKTQVVTHFGVKSRSDNRFYPRCVSVKNSKKNDEEMKKFIMDGISPEQAKEEHIVPGMLHGEVIEDKYAGTLVPGTLAIDNIVTFWSKSKNEWLEGNIVALTKLNKIGNDAVNHLTITVQDDDGELHETIGAELHPKHRESRYFKGLRNMFPNEEDQKDFLITVAKKLNIVKPEVNLDSVNRQVQLNVLSQIKQLTRRPYNELQTPMNVFARERIMDLTKRPYVAAMIPTEAVRCLLFIMDFQQAYLVEESSKVMKVQLDVPQKYTYILFDGFVTDDLVYYPIDIFTVSEDGNAYELTADYLVDPLQGRLKVIHDITGSISKIHGQKMLTVMNPYSTLSNKYGFIGPIDPNESLPEYVHRMGTNNKSIVFVPQKGHSAFLYWKNGLVDPNVVLRLLKQESPNEWYVGMVDDTGKLNKFLKPTLHLKHARAGKFVQVKINVGPNGDQDKDTPYTNVVYDVPEEDVKSYNETRIQVHSILRPVQEYVFTDPTRWVFSTFNITLVPGHTSRDPLVSEE